MSPRIRGSGTQASFPSSTCAARRTTSFKPPKDLTVLHYMVALPKCSGSGLFPVLCGEDDISEGVPVNTGRLQSRKKSYVFTCLHTSSNKSTCKAYSVKVHTVWIHMFRCYGTMIHHASTGPPRGDSEHAPALHLTALGVG